jgi:OmpA-OmpF porin, OOP family
MNKISKIAVAVAALGLSGSLAAQGIASDSGFGIEGAVGYYWPDNDTFLDDGVSWGLGLEYRIGPHWAINGWWLQTENLDFDRENVDRGDGDIENLHLDLTYYFHNGRWQPYVSLGGGQRRVNNDFDDYDLSQFNLGMGLKFHMTPGLFLRTELRAFSGQGETDVSALLSLGYTFGQHATVA